MGSLYCWKKVNERYRCVDEVRQHELNWSLKELHWILHPDSQRKPEKKSRKQHRTKRISCRDFSRRGRLGLPGTAEQNFTWAYSKDAFPQLSILFLYFFIYFFNVCVFPACFCWCPWSHWLAFLQQHSMPKNSCEIQIKIIIIII